MYPTIYRIQFGQIILSKIMISHWDLSSAPSNYGVFTDIDVQLLVSRTRMSTSSMSSINCFLVVNIEYLWHVSCYTIRTSVQYILRRFFRLSCLCWLCGPTSYDLYADLWTFVRIVGGWPLIFHPKRLSRL